MAQLLTKLIQNVGRTPPERPWVDRLSGHASWSMMVLGPRRTQGFQAPFYLCCLVAPVRNECIKAANEVASPTDKSSRAAFSVFDGVADAPFQLSAEHFNPLE